MTWAIMWARAGIAVRDTGITVRAAIITAITGTQINTNPRIAIPIAGITAIIGPAIDGAVIGVSVIGIAIIGLIITRCSVILAITVITAIAICLIAGIVIAACDSSACDAANNRANSRTFVLIVAACDIGADDAANNCAYKTADKLISAITGLMSVLVAIVMGIGSDGNGQRERGDHYKFNWEFHNISLWGLELSYY